MDELFLLAIFFIIIAIVLPIYLFFSNLGLKDRVRILERELRAVEAKVKSLNPQNTDITPTAIETPTAEPTVVTPELPAEPEAEPEVPAKQPWKDPESIAARVESDDKVQVEDVEVAAQEATPSYSPPKAYVFKEGLAVKIVSWFQQNWFFAVAAVSLALAGVFFVQYGIENGLLSPRLRVIGAIVLGLLLIGGGEYIRRKLGSDEDGSFELLPSVLSGAGLVSIFAGVLAANLMYGLIGSGTAFLGLVLTGLLGIVLGWFYGPLLACFGVLGALVAPFLVGGDSDSAHLLQIYFAVIMIMALAIDSFKRWAWLSVLGSIGAYLAAWVLYLGIGQEFYLVVFALIAAMAAIIIPERRLWPMHAGSNVTSPITNVGASQKAPPEFPTRLAGGAFIASTALVCWIGYIEPMAFDLVISVLILMFVAAFLWLQDAEALDDLAYFPAGAFLAILTNEGLRRGVVHQSWIEDKAREQLDFASPMLAILLACGLLMSLLFAWRSWQSQGKPAHITLVAAAFAPITAIILDLLWVPRFVLGVGNWALYLAVVAVAMTFLAERFSRKDGEDRLRTALFALSAISMISFMLIVLLSGAALTVSVAVMIVVAAWMGAKFDLPLFDRYVQVGIVAVTARLVFYPGIEWAIYMPIREVVLVFIAVIGMLAVTVRVKRKDASVGVDVMLESAIWSLGGIFASIMLFRYLSDYVDRSTVPIYLFVGLLATIWLILSANQLYRIRPNVGLRKTRKTLAALYGAIGVVLLAIIMWPLNPVISFFDNGSVIGMPIIDSLAATYLPPALIAAIVAIRFKHLSFWFRKLLGFAAAGIALMYVGLEIRRLWRGGGLNSTAMSDGELYSYTIAMLIISGVLLGFAFFRQSALLRKLALVAVGITVAKVFVLDMSGLGGLIRVVSFLVLGLVLAAMAWINRILQRNEARDEA